MMNWAHDISLNIQLFTSTYDMSASVETKVRPSDSELNAV